MTKQQPPETIGDLITKAGAENIVAEIKRRNPKRHFTKSAVLKWNKRGIPDGHWDVVMKLTGVSLSRIYAINSKVRDASRRAKRRDQRRAVAS